MGRGQGLNEQGISAEAGALKTPGERFILGPLL
jgi:hypothetical protein